MANISFKKLDNESERKRRLSGPKENSNLFVDNLKKIKYDAVSKNMMFEVSALS